MAGFPEPEAASLFRTRTSGKKNEERGQTEGRKDRPCAEDLGFKPKFPRLADAIAAGA
jgi:hypothetical protein